MLLHLVSSLLNVATQAGRQTDRPKVILYIFNTGFDAKLVYFVAYFHDGF